MPVNRTANLRESSAALHPGLVNFPRFSATGSPDQSPPAAPFSPVFIVGCPRSGTTLLAAMIDRHSRFAATPETHFLDETFARSRRATSSQSILAALTENQRVADCGLDLAAVRQDFQSGPATHARLLRLLLEQYGALCGKPCVAEKTPDHLRHVPTILRWFPHAKVICIMRDGRDVVMSLQNVQWACHDPRENARRWRRDAGRALQFRKRFPQQFRLIRFEDLVRDPAASLTEVMQFAGSQFEPGQLDSNRPTGVVPAWELPWKAKSSQALDPAKAQAWKTLANSEQIQTMNALMGPDLIRCGYDDVPNGQEPLAKAIWLKLCQPALQDLDRLRQRTVRSLKRRFSAATGSC